MYLRIDQAPTFLVYFTAPIRGAQIAINEGCNLLIETVRSQCRLLIDAVNSLFACVSADFRINEGCNLLFETVSSRCRLLIDAVNSLLRAYL